MHTHYTLLATATLIPIALMVAFIFYYLLKNKSNGWKLLPIRLVAIILVAAEAFKQYYSYTSPEGYNLWHLPLHICSIFILSLPIAVFTKQKSKVSKVAWAVSISTGIMMTIGILAVPEVIIGYATQAFFDGSASILDYHSVGFHYIIVFFVFLTVLLKVYKPTFLQILIGSIVYLLYAGLMVTMAIVLDVNFAMLLEFPAVPAIDALRSDLGLWVFQSVMVGSYVAAFIICGLLMKIISAFGKKAPTPAPTPVEEPASA